MIFKVLYQEDQLEAPRRESTKTLYVEAEDQVEARSKVTANKPYMIELVQELSEAHLAYEQEHNPDFEVTEF